MDIQDGFPILPLESVQVGELRLWKSYTLLYRHPGEHKLLLVIFVDWFESKESSPCY
jgi:hypothetical protein